MTTWLYRLAKNESFPMPEQELEAMCAAAENDEAYLLLAGRESPPGFQMKPDDEVLLITGDWREGYTARAVVDRPVERFAMPPENRMRLYDAYPGRQFVRLRSCEAVEHRPLPVTAEELETLMRGQSSVKRIDETVSRLAETPAPAAAPSDDLSRTSRWGGVSALAGPAFSVLGLDPTAGSAEEAGTNTKKKMPSVEVRWDGARLTIGRSELHRSNAEFWERARSMGAKAVCIDGPCGTNGLTPSIDWRTFSIEQNHGQRECEQVLSKMGCKLYWTTRATVESFDGARRWIGRSLMLFNEAVAQSIPAVETHPHAAFRVLWAALGDGAKLEPKGTERGRAQRRRLLASVATGTSYEELTTSLPSHDDIDAAVAACVAALHVLGATSSVGSDARGGLIHLPRM